MRYDVFQGEDVYDFGYEYDPDGNRTRKIDAVNELELRCCLRRGPGLPSLVHIVFSLDGSVLADDASHGTKIP